MSAVVGVGRFGLFEPACVSRTLSDVPRQTLTNPICHGSGADVEWIASLKGNNLSRCKEL